MKYWALTILILKFFTLPLVILIFIGKFYALELPYYKFRMSLTKSLQLHLYRWFLSLTREEIGILMVISNRHLLKYLKYINWTLMSDFPNFAASYDRNAIWISRPNEAGSSDPLIIYLHGGGYYFEAQKSQFESVMAIYLLLKPEMRRKTSILFLDYKLASHGYPIPYQLDQLRDTYINLCKRDGHSNVTLLGDSAGGHLALSFLKHLSDVKEKLVYPKKLILVSPWVDLTHNATTITPESSYMRCKEIDMIDCRSFELKLPDVLGESDPFSLQISPALKPSSKDNWESIVTLNDNQSDVLIIMGEHESLTDEITKFCKNCLEIDLETSKEFKENYVYTRKGVAGKCNVRIFMEPHGIHDSTFFFEQDCLSVIKSKRDSSGVLHSLDRNEYFGIVRISEFLNETMYVT